MRLLILGGTVFLGKALTDAALAAGHDVTHFNRGRSAPDDARVETLHGDRTDAAALAKAARAWDAVIDTSGYLPQVVRLSVEALRGSGRYLFVSSISAYAGSAYGEDAPLAPPPDPVPETMAMEMYGALKAMCESVVSEAFGPAAVIVRPGLIVGPHDSTDRFTWWPARIARGGRIAAPGRARRTVQFIDVRDLAEWMVALLERGADGVFNATGPSAPIAMQQVLEACRAAVDNDAELEWIDEPFLAAEGVQPWKEMPLWIPESEAYAAGFMSVPLARALGAGLRFRDLEETVADTLAWERTRPAQHEWKAGLAASREDALLAAWDRRPRSPAG